MSIRKTLFAFFLFSLSASASYAFEIDQEGVNTVVQKAVAQRDDPSQLFGTLISFQAFSLQSPSQQQLAQDTAGVKGILSTFRDKVEGGLESLRRTVSQEKYQSNPFIHPLFLRTFSMATAENKGLQDFVRQIFYNQPAPVSVVDGTSFAKNSPELAFATESISLPRDSSYLSLVNSIVVGFKTSEQLRKLEGILTDYPNITRLRACPNTWRGPIKISEDVMREFVSLQSLLSGVGRIESSELIGK